MKNITRLAVVVLFCLPITNRVTAQSSSSEIHQAVPEEYGYLVKIGQQIPSFELTLSNGKKVSSDSWKGKVVMLQFTASWCGVCRKEMPFIESDIWQKNKRNPNFVLFGVDRDEPLEKVRQFQKDIGITYPMALDPQANIFGRFADKKAGVTRNVIIDKNGKIAFLTRLYKEEEFREMVKVIEKLLKQ